MTRHDELDPLSDLLSSVALPPTDPVRREAIFAQTRGVLRRRRFVRRSAWAAALAACYVIGALSVLGWQSARPHNQLGGQPGGAVQIKDPASPEKSKPAQPRQEPPRPEPTRLPEPQKPAASVEPAASLTTFEKLRRAGDRQLNERGNLHGAIGCYRRALDFASDDDLQIVPERDSWLLIPLKEARLETRKHVYKKG